MDKNAEEVTRAIAIKLLGGIEGFKLTKLENYKDYIVYFAFPDGVTGEINVGRPIYVLIDELGKARFATSEERHEIWHRNDPELEDGEDEDVEYIELPGLAALIYGGQLFVDGATA